MKELGLKFIGEELKARIILAPDERNPQAKGQDGELLPLITRELDDGSLYCSFVVTPDIAPVKFTADGPIKKAEVVYARQQVEAASATIFREPKDY